MTLTLMKNEIKSEGDGGGVRWNDEGENAAKNERYVCRFPQWKSRFRSFTRPKFDAILLGRRNNEAHNFFGDLLERYDAHGIFAMFVK